MSEDCDWLEIISCCCEVTMKLIPCLCSTTQALVQESNCANPVNSNGACIDQQPLNQGNPYSSQQISPQGCLPEQQILTQQQFGVQQCPPAPSLGFIHSAPFPENNYYASNQSNRGIASSNYLAPPPSYSEAVGVESYRAP